MDHWSALEQGVQSGSGPRNTMIYNLDDNFVQSVLRSSTFHPKFQVNKATTTTTTTTRARHHVFPFSFINKVLNYFLKKIYEFVL